MKIKCVVGCMTALFSVGALAGGPDAPMYPGAGFNVGAQAGLVANVATASATYEGTGSADSPAFQNYSTSNFNTAGLIGVNVGYSWLINTNLIGLAFSFNGDTGQETFIGHLDDVQSPSGNPHDLVQTVNEKMQYNLILKLKHFVSSSFNVFAGIGASALDTQISFSAPYIGGPTSGNTSGPGATQNSYLWGGVLEVGSEYFLSKHSAINATVDYFAYASKNINNLSNLDTNGESNLINRKVTVSMPAIMFGYNYYF